MPPVDEVSGEDRRAFLEFSALLESRLMMSWRSSLCHGDEELESRVSTALVTYRLRPGGWEFSFAVRALEAPRELEVPQKVWCQQTAETAPVRYSVTDPPPVGEIDGNMSPENVASSVATELLDRILGSPEWKKVAGA